ncbi:unnamed protein product, partial [Symbiodinium sp. CCMP2592]
VPLQPPQVAAKATHRPLRRHLQRSSDRRKSRPPPFAQRLARPGRLCSRRSGSPHQRQRRLQT